MDLVEAVKTNNIPLVKQLIVNGADTTFVDRSGWSALRWSIFRGNVDCFKLLLESNVDVNKDLCGESTLLYCAVYHNRGEFSKLLIEYKANINILTSHGRSALHTAVERHSSEMIRILLNAKADVNIHIPFYNSPLVTAITQRNEKAVEWLLDQGADFSYAKLRVQIPTWVYTIIWKKQCVKQTYLTFYGVLRKRCMVCLDMTRELTRRLWSMRFEEF